MPIIEVVMTQMTRLESWDFEEIAKVHKEVTEEDDEVRKVRLQMRRIY